MNNQENPKIAGTSPLLVNLEAGKNYAWCSCGLSSKQPWCDGSHKGSRFSPTVFSVEEEKDARICMCKQAKNPIYCDGSHKNI